jgi:hypothetical protein
VRDLVVSEAVEEFAAQAAERLRQLIAAGEELPYDLSGPGEDSPLCQYEPQTARFVRDNAAVLTDLDSFGRASKAIELAELAEDYLELLGEDVPEGRERQAEAATVAFLCRLWDGLADFPLDGRRLGAAIGELEGGAELPAGDAEVVVPLIGFHMPTTRLDLGIGTLVRADTVDVPEDARRPEGTRRAGWEPQFLAVVRGERGSDDEPVGGPGPMLRGVVTILRLFKEGGVGLGPHAWARTRGDRWTRISTGAGCPRPGGYRLAEAELGELASFARAVTADSGMPLSGGPGPGGALARAMSRFEVGVERPALLEAVSDYLLALRFVLEGGGAAEVGLGMRVAALRAEPGERIAVKHAVTQAQTLEDELMRGDAPSGGSGSPLQVAAELEDLIRGILREAIGGEHGGDLRAAADEILLADGIAAGEGAVAMRGTTEEWDAIQPEELPADVQEVVGPAAKQFAEDEDFVISEPKTTPEIETSERDEEEQVTEHTASDEPTQVMGDWLSEVGSPESLDWPDRPEALKLLARRPAEREKARKRVSHLFPQPETTEWSVAELRYSREEARRRSRARA